MAWIEHPGDKIAREVLELEYERCKRSIVHACGSALILRPCAISLRALV